MWEDSPSIDALQHTSCGSSWETSVMRKGPRGSKVLKVDLCVSLSYFPFSSLGHFPSALCAKRAKPESIRNHTHPSSLLNTF